jgi:type VI secretion system protein ImpG
VRSDQDERYQAYLLQLQMLNDFRALHRERHPSAITDDDDPDVNRIIESLAYFTVGTQLAAQNNMRTSLERLLSGYFEFLLWPMPAMGRVQLLNTDQLIDTPTVPEGAALSLEAPDGSVGWFRTLHDLPIIHARLEKTEVVVLEDGFRVLVSLRSPYPVRGMTGPLSLYVHCLDRFVASLRLTHNLRKHLKGVSAFFDERALDRRSGAPCDVQFGAVVGAATVCSNPLERLRMLLHYPELELSVQVGVPDAPKPWTRLVLAFDLDSKWPDARPMAADPFVLHSVPVINLRRAPAAAIRHDGLRFVHPIGPNEREREFELASIVGVYELEQERRGLAPIPPSGLPANSEGYEIERIQTQGGMRYRLILRLPDALAQPRNVVVEVDWHQPRFGDSANGTLKVALSDRYIDGLQMRVLGAVRPSAPSPLAQLSSALLELLALRMKPTLRVNELIALLRLLGIDGDSPFHPLLERIRDLTVDASPDLGAISTRYRYQLRFEAVAPGDEALVWTLTNRIRELLDAWSGGDAVSVDLEIDASAGPGKR